MQQKFSVEPAGGSPNMAENWASRARLEAHDAEMGPHSSRCGSVDAGGCTRAALLKSSGRDTGKHEIGLLSSDRKTLVSEENDVWSVSNPEALAGLEGKQVLVKCQLFAEKSVIHVFAAKVAAAVLKNASNKGDSAFRR